MTDEQSNNPSPHPDETIRREYEIVFDAPGSDGDYWRKGVTTVIPQSMPEAVFLGREWVRGQLANQLDQIDLGDGLINVEVSIHEHEITERPDHPPRARIADAEDVEVAFSEWTPTHDLGALIQAIKASRRHREALAEGDSEASRKTAAAAFSEAMSALGEDSAALDARDQLVAMCEGRTTPASDAGEVAAMNAPDKNAGASVDDDPLGEPDSPTPDRGPRLGG